MKKKAARDMTELVDILRADSKFRGVDCDKLQFILEHSELHVPAGWPERFDITHIREYAAPAPDPVRLSSRRVPRYARWALVPACAAAAAVLFFLVWPQISVNNNRAGTITHVSGGSTVSHHDGEGRLDAGDSLAAGDVIVTGSGSSLDISFNESIRMRVLGGSRITLGRVELGRRRVFDALVSTGACIMQVSKLSPGESVSLHTPTSEASVKGTSFSVRVSDDGGVRYEVYEGTVRVRRRLPADSSLGRATAEHLSRYFRTHELMLEKGKACRINPDAVSPGSAKLRSDRGPIAGLSLPVVLEGPAALIMKREAATFAGLTPESEGAVVDEKIRQAVHDAIVRSDASRKRVTEREPSVMSGQQYLIYVPETESIVTIGESFISSSHAGKSLWRLDLNDAIASMPVRDGVSLYFATVHGNVSMLDLDSGTVRWTTLPDSAARAPSRLVLDGSGIYFAVSQGVVGRLDRRGDLQWKSSIGEEISAGPVLTRHMVLIPTRKGTLVGIDKYRGLNAISIGFSGRIVSIGTKQDMILVATDDGRLSAYSMRDAKIMWHYPINDVFAGDVIIENDSIYLFGRAGKVHRVSMSGEQIWTRDAGNPIVKRATEDPECFYLPSEQTLCVINKISGDITWSLMVPGIRSGNVAVYRGTIYFQNEKNGLTCLKK